MKIAFLTPEFPHPKIGVTGGIGTSISNLASGLVSLGHDVSVLIYGQAEDDAFTDSGISFYRIKNIKFKGLSWWLTRKKIEKHLNRLYAEGKVEIAEAPDWVGISSFINANCPLVVRLHGSDTYFCHLDKRPVKSSSRFQEGRALRRADALLSVSRYTADVTNQLFGLNRDFTVIPNGVDLEKFEPAEPVENQVVLYFGTLIRKKGLLELPYIFNAIYQQNPSARLVLVGRDAPDISTGNSSTWEMMKPMFSVDAFKHVKYVGGVPYNEMRDYINNAAVCIFPTFAEALPVSWIEAMAMKKPLVASNIGWATEIIDDGADGFLVHPKNHNAFAEKVNALLSDASLRETIGNAARRKVENRFEKRLVAAQNIAFYSTLLK